MGVYAEFDDVADRYEADMPTERQSWVELRIDDAEAELLGLVPDLQDPGEVPADRAGRVRRLICDKVLALFRNPDGAVTISNTLGPYAASRTLTGKTGSWVSFTADELAAVGYVAPTGTTGSVALRAWYYP